MSTRRSYRQNCALAIALDMVGERWTLLIVRELLIGPKRFGELLNNLPGMGTNLLTDRLNQLLDDNLIRRNPATGGHPVYELSETGRQLEKVVYPLIQWGMQFWQRRSPEQHQRPEWDILPLRSYFNPEAGNSWRGIYELAIDGNTLFLANIDGVVTEIPEPEIKPVATIVMSSKIAGRIASGHLNVNSAVKQGEIKTTGAKKDVDLFFRALRPG